MKRLAILLAAEEAVAAYHEMLEHPSPEAERNFRGSFALLILRLAVWQRDGLAVGEPIPQAMQVSVGASWREALHNGGSPGTPGVVPIQMARAATDPSETP